MSRPTQHELLLRFFPEVKGQGGGATEAAVQLNVRACEAVLAELLKSYDRGLAHHGDGALVVRLGGDGNRAATFMSADDLGKDLALAERLGDMEAQSFIRSTLTAITGHNPATGGLMVLLDNSRCQVLPLIRAYPARAIEQLFAEVIA